MSATLYTGVKYRVSWRWQPGGYDNSYESGLDYEADRMYELLKTVNVHYLKKERVEFWGRFKGERTYLLSPIPSSRA